MKNMNMKMEENTDLCKKIVYTAGSWDLFHIGHLHILQRVRSMGDIMIVGVSTDQLILEYKGHLPIDPFDIRYETICKVSKADVVIPQIRQFNSSRMSALGVTHIIMGDDWKDSTHPALQELKNKFSVIFISRTQGVSTSSIRRKLGV